MVKCKLQLDVFLQVRNGNSSRTQQEALVRGRLQQQHRHAREPAGLWGTKVRWKKHNKFVFKLQSAFSSFQTITVYECCLIIFLIIIYILALEMASPGNRHCANGIGTLSFPITHAVVAF